MNTTRCVEYAPKEKPMTHKPCPFCGSSRLREDDVTLCTDDGEVDVTVVECLDCDAQARVEWWNERREPIPSWKQPGDAEAPGIAAL